MTFCKKALSLIFLILIFISITLHLSFAGNNDSLPSYGYTGTGDDLWKHNSHYSAMRISIYWAPNSRAFKAGVGVIPLGNTTDVSKTEPWYKVERYTKYSIYWHMNKDNIHKTTEINFTESIDTPYTWVGEGEVYDSNGQDVVESMPDVWNGTKEQWDNCYARVCL